MNEKKHYIADLSALRRAEPGWMQRYRQKAIEQFERTDFPSTRDEEWRFTNIAPMLKIPFRTKWDKATDTPNVPIPFPPEWPRLVFLNGRFLPDLSSLQNVKGLSYGGFHQYAGSDFMKQYLGSAVQLNDAFTFLNSAFLQDGGIFRIAPGTVLETPLVILYATNELVDTAIHPRNVIIAGEGSEFSILESYWNATGTRQLSNSLTEVIVENSALVEHCKFQQENESGYHIASTHVMQGRDSSYSSFLLTIGAGLSRNELHVRMHGQGAHCVLNGVYLVSGDQVADHHTVIDHATLHTSSRELYKGILSGSSRGIFNGRIIVRKDAQKTDARQMNKNLLISDGARINTKPQLEILADDVKCTHGATIGHLEDAELFYLRSRGIAESTARFMLMAGFTEEASEVIRNDRLREIANGFMMNRLAQFIVGNAA